MDTPEEGFENDLSPPPEVDRLKAKKEVLRLLKSRPGVGLHIGAPQDASEKELLIALARTDSPRGTLRAAGYDAQSANKAAALLPDALWALSQQKPRRKWRKHWWKCALCAGLMFLSFAGLLFGFLWVDVFEKAGWNEGECTIAEFYNSSCQLDDGCKFRVTVYQEGGGPLSMQPWSPELDREPRSNRVTFVGDAFRCCESPEWDCCGFVDETMYFCDKWPHRRAADGTQCPNGKWECLYKTDPLNPELVTDLKPVLPNSWKYSLLVACIVFCFLCCCFATSCFWEHRLLNSTAEAKKAQSAAKYAQQKVQQLASPPEASPRPASAASRASVSSTATGRPQSAASRASVSSTATGQPSSPSASSHATARPMSAASSTRLSAVSKASERPLSAASNTSEHRLSAASSASIRSLGAGSGADERASNAGSTASGHQQPAPGGAKDANDPAPVLPRGNAADLEGILEEDVKGTPRPPSAAGSSGASAADLSIILDPLSEGAHPAFAGTGNGLKRLAAEHNKNDLFRPIIAPLDLNSRLTRPPDRAGLPGRGKAAHQRRLRVSGQLSHHGVHVPPEMWGWPQASQGGSRQQSAGSSRADDPRLWAWADQAAFLDGHHVVDVGQSPKKSPLTIDIGHSPQKSPLRVTASRPITPTGIAFGVQGSPCNSQAGERALHMIMDLEEAGEIEALSLGSRPRASRNRRRPDPSNRHAAIAAAAVRETVSRGSSRLQ